MTDNLYNLDHYRCIASCKPPTTFNQFKIALLHYTEHKNKPPIIEALGRQIQLMPAEHVAEYVRQTIYPTSPEQLFFIKGYAKSGGPLMSVLRGPATVRASDDGLVSYKSPSGIPEDVETEHNIQVGSFQVEQPPILIRCAEWGPLLNIAIYVHKKMPNAKTYALQISKATMGGQLTILYLHSWAIPDRVLLPQISTDDAVTWLREKILTVDTPLRFRLLVRTEKYPVGATTLIVEAYGWGTAWEIEGRPMDGTDNKGEVAEFRVTPAPKNEVEVTAYCYWDELQPWYQAVLSAIRPLAIKERVLESERANRSMAAWKEALSGQEASAEAQDTELINISSTPRRPTVQHTRDKSKDQITRQTAGRYTKPALDDAYGYLISTDPIYPEGSVWDWYLKQELILTKGEEYLKSPKNLALQKGGFWANMRNRGYKRKRI